MTEARCQSFHIYESHGSVSSLYRALCNTCDWISGDSSSQESAEEEGRRHLEGRPMPWQEATDWQWAPPMSPPLPDWPTAEELEQEQRRQGTAGGGSSET